MLGRRTLVVVALASVQALATSGALIAFAVAAPAPVRAEGELVRYDTTLVPSGGWARVQEMPAPKDLTIVTLKVRGLLPGHDYGAHAHVNACGSTGSAAGPHYQDVVAPTGHGTDPAYANPDNEVWLDLTTDEDGNGSAQALVRWHFRVGGASSVVLHASHTHTEPGAAGTAGARLACISVPF